MTNNEDKLKRMNELLEEFKILYIEMFEDIAKDLDKYNKILEIINEYREEEKKPINIIPAQYVVNEILEVLENDL